MRKASTCQLCNAPLTLEMERDEALCVGCMRYIHDHHLTPPRRRTWPLTPPPAPALPSAWPNA